MSKETEDLVAYMERLASEAPILTPEEQLVVRNNIKFNKKARLAHNLLALKRGTVNADIPMGWILQLYDEQQAEIDKLRKYRYNARVSIRRLQAAYNELRLNVLERALISPEKLFEVVGKAAEKMMAKMGVSITPIMGVSIDPIVKSGTEVVAGFQPGETVGLTTGIQNGTKPQQRYG